MEDTTQLALRLDCNNYSIRNILMYMSHGDWYIPDKYPRSLSNPLKLDDYTLINYILTNAHGGVATLQLTLYLNKSLDLTNLALFNSVYLSILTIYLVSEYDDISIIISKTSPFAGGSDTLYLDFSNNIKHIEMNNLDADNYSAILINMGSMWTNINNCVDFLYNGIYVSNLVYFMSIGHQKYIKLNDTQYNVRCAIVNLNNDIHVSDCILYANCPNYSQDNVSDLIGYGKIIIFRSNFHTSALYDESCAAVNRDWSGTRISPGIVYLEGSLDAPLIYIYLEYTYYDSIDFTITIDISNFDYQNSKANIFYIKYTNANNEYTNYGEIKVVNAPEGFDTSKVGLLDGTYVIEYAK